MSKGFLKVVIFMLKVTGKDPSKFGKNQDIDLESIARVTFPVHAKINYSSVVDIRDRASACHASQGGKQMAGGIQGVLRKVFQSNETFMQAYPSEVPARPIKDLFEGMDTVSR
jgi:hypothetical protein